MKSTKKKAKKRSKRDIRFGQKDLLPEDAFNPKETKFRVTMYVDMDVLSEIRKRAKDKGLPYQTYINQYLRDTHLGSEEEKRVRRIVQEELAKRTG